MALSGTFKQYAQDDITRELGLNSALYAEERRLEALDDPRSFLAKRKKAIELVKDATNAEYKAKLTRYSYFGYAPDVARRMAEQDAQAFYLREIQLIEREFPIPVVDASASRMFAETALPLAVGFGQYKASKGEKYHKYKSYYKASKGKKGKRD